ncbi:MAG: polysaccharide biosynthesis/export family protein [Bacteroidales bacterium]|nr:polysaccharide biosynthesis/export family protein [Bacteroidales bacterium]
MRKFFLLFTLAFISLTACRTYEKINYIQDVKPGVNEPIDNFSAVRIQPRDMISIVISSRNPELSKLFNLPVVSYQAGSEFSETGTSQRLLGYTVSDDGTIDFPILGTLHLEGLSRKETADLIKKKLIDGNYIKDPVVTVQFLNFKVAVIGEVTMPGTYTFEGDKLTVLDALGLAKDLTIFGRRDRVFVIREQNGERTIYQLDLRSVEMFKSPAYYLKQNDVVYVEPNNVRAGQSTINENNVKSVSLWISIGSFLATIATLLVNVIHFK